MPALPPIPTRKKSVISFNGAVACEPRRQMKHRVTKKNPDASMRNMSMILGHFLFEFSVYLPDPPGSLLVC